MLLTFEDVVIFDAMGSIMFPHIFGVIAIRKPKTRRLPSHPPVQHALVEDRAVATFISYEFSCIPLANRSGRLWHGSPDQFRRIWNNCLKSLRLSPTAYTSAGLRGGGATETYLRTQDTLAVRRRGRWTQLATLDRNLQEGVVLLNRRSPAFAFVVHIAMLASAVFPDFDHHDPNHHTIHREQ